MEDRFNKICRASAKADRSKTFTKQPTPTVQPTPDYQATSPSETATGPTKDLSGDIQQQTLQPVQQLIAKVNNMKKHQEQSHFACTVDTGASRTIVSVKTFKDIQKHKTVELDTTTLFVEVNGSKLDDVGHGTGANQELLRISLTRT